MGIYIYGLFAYCNVPFEAYSGIPHVQSLRDLTLSKICSLTSAPTLGETGVDAISGKGS